MKTLIFLLTFCMASAIADVDSCRLDAQAYGDIYNARSFPPDCFAKAMESKSPKNSARSPDGTMEIIGFQNMVYLVSYGEEKEIDQVDIVAGENTKLENVEVLRADWEEGRFYVLNKSGSSFSILSFPTNLSGNIAPRRKLVTNDLGGASDFVIEGEEIYAISARDGWIKVFNKLGDPDGHLPEHSVETKRSIAGAATEIVSPDSIDVANEEIIIQDSGRALRFSKSATGDVPPLLPLEGSSEGSIAPIP